MRREKLKSDYIIDVFNYTLMIILFLVTFYPFWNVFVVSINDPLDTMRGGLTLFPRILTFSSYGVILSDVEFTDAIWVTVKRVIVGTPLTILCTAMLSYVLTKKDLIGYKFLRTLFVFTMYFGGGIIPTYMIYKTLGLTDSFMVYIIPGLVGVYYMILMNSFMNQLPAEIEESATIDGANELTIFFRFILPLSKPILATITLYVAINHWNSFFDSYLYTNKQSLKTLQAVMMKILNQYKLSGYGDSTSAAASAIKNQSATPDSIRMAATMVSTIPIIMVYPFVQKYFVQGMMVGSVKG